MKKIFLTGLSLFLFLVCIFILPLTHPAGIAVYIRLVLLIAILAESSYLFTILVIDRGHESPKRLLSNAATVLFSFFILFIVLETVFMFIPRSHSADFTLASRLWYARYWKPVNTLGFRDREPDGSRPVI